MNNLLQILRIASYNLKKWLVNPKIYVIVILLFCYVHFMEAPIKVFSQSTGIGLPPYLIPFFLSSPYSGKIVLLLLILLFCDAPFAEEEYAYIAIRSGRAKWYLGQALYIFLASAIYSALIWAATAIVTIPCLEFTPGWGKVINTFAQTGNASAHGIVVPFDYAILQAFSPLEALGVQFVLCTSLFMMFGNVMFFINTATGRAVGALAATGIVLFQLFAENGSLTLTYFSPATWISLSFLSIDGRGRYPSLSYALLTLLCINVILCMLSFIIVQKKDIEVQKHI